MNLEGRCPDAGPSRPTGSRAVAVDRFLEAAGFGRLRLDAFVFRGFLLEGKLLIDPADLELAALNARAPCR